MTLVHVATGAVVASSVDMALTRRDRRKGLLGRDSLGSNAAMFIAPCVAIHTVGMEFPIDVAFIDARGTVVRLVHSLQPWRLAASFRGCAVVELAAGRLAECGVNVGDRLSLTGQAVLTPKRVRRFALVGVVGTGAVLWLGAPWPPAARTIPTGAGFTVPVTQLRTEPQARTIASRIAAAGIPTFTRRNDSTYQVVAGPYVSLDEADRTQRFFARRGFKARVVVDESVRRPAGRDSAPLVNTAANVVLIAGAGSVAVVIELPEEPRYVATQTHGGGQLEIVAGPVASRVEPAQWEAPAGVALLRSVAIDEAVQGTARSLRARVTTPRSVQATVRTAGRRIYIDLAELAAFPQPEELAIGPALTASRQRVVEDYRVTVEPLMERLETIEPFVMSAVAQPAGDVLAALERSLRALEAWADEVTPPGQWRQSHEFIVSAVTKAAESVSASFTGDRAVKAREAFALRDAAKRSLDPPADPPATTP